MRIFSETYKLRLVFTGERNNKRYKAIRQCQAALNKFHNHSESPPYAGGWSGHTYVSTAIKSELHSVCHKHGAAKKMF